MFFAIRANNRWPPRACARVRVCACASKRIFAPPHTGAGENDLFLAEKQVAPKESLAYIYP